MESSDRQMANGTRLCRLLIDKGTEAMRKIFDRIHPPTTWDSTLMSYRSSLKKRIPVLNSAQMNIIYPPGASTKNWNKKPPLSDKTVEADLARIKYYRNVLYGHITTTSLSNNQFKQYWTEISEALVRLGLDAGDLEYLKTAPLEDDLFIEKLKEWKENEDMIEIELQTMKKEQAKIKCLLQALLASLVLILVLIIVYLSFNQFFTIIFPHKRVIDLPSSHIPIINDSSFFGRHWLFQELEERINTSNSIRGLLIVAVPGFGKSSIIKQLISTPTSSYFIHKNIIAYHVCKFDERETRNVGHFVKNIVYLVEKKIPELSRVLNTDESIQKKLDDCENYPHICFQKAVLEPIQKLRNPPKTAFILIDALDECREIDEESYDSSILQILHGKGTSLPKWIKFVLSSRNVTTVTGKLSEIGVPTLHIRATDKRNLMDVRSFIKNTFKNHPEMIAKESGLNHSIDILSQRAQGNFLFIKTILEFSKDDPKTLYDENVFSTGTLGRLYALSFRERYKERDFKQIQPMLEVLLASSTPLKLNELEGILYFKNNVPNTPSFKNVIKQISPYIIHSDDGTVRFFHQSFSDWLVNQTEGIKGLFIEKSRGHRLIAEYLLYRFDNVKKPSLKQLSELSMHVLYAGMIKSHIDKLLAFNVSQIRGGNINRTILHDLAKAKGSTRILEVYIKEFSSVDISDEHGCPPSFYAARAGNIDNLELLITNGGDVNFITPRTMYTLPESPTEMHHSTLDESLTFITATTGNTKMAQILLDNGAKIDEVNTFGLRPVHEAAEYGHINLVQVLISHGAKADNIALHHAAARNHTEIVEYLLKTGHVRDICLPCKPGNISSCYTSRNVSINQTHLCFCETALHAAVSRGHTQIVKWLLSYGNESVNCKHHSGKTPLMDAVERNDRDMVKLLLTNGADINVKCANEIPSMLGQRYECFFTGFYAKMEEKKFVYTSYCNKPACYSGMSIIHLCARRGLWEMTEYLVSTWNADLLALDNLNISIINCAAIHDHADFIRKFRAKYIKVESFLFSMLGRKATLKNIVRCGSKESLRLFYNENNYKSFSENYVNNCTLLHVAAMWSPHPTPPNGYDIDSQQREIFSCTDVLNNHDCLTKMQSVEHCFPAKPFRKEYEKRLKVVKLLTKYEQNINTKDADGRTALHYAAWHGFVGAVRHLVREGSDWRIKDNKGITPLMMALKGVPVDRYFFRVPSYQTSNKDHYFQFSKSTAFDHTVSYLIRLHNTTINKCNYQTKSILVKAITHKLHLTLYSLFENGVNVNCGDGLKTHLSLSTISAKNIAEISEVFKIFQLDVSENCGAPFVESEIHLMAYFGELSDMGNFFRPSYNNHSFPLQRFIDHHPKGFRILDECYDNEGYLPIHRAVQGGNIDAIEWFLELGVNMWKKTTSGWNSLDLAIYLLVPERFGNIDFKTMKGLTESSPLNHFYSMRYSIHHALLFHRFSNNQGTFDYLKGVVTVQNIRKRVFNKLLEQAFNTSNLKSSPILQLWYKTDSSDLSPLHIAASLGMEMLDDIRKKLQTVTDLILPLRCRNKHNIEPLYLAYLYDSVEAAEHVRQVFLRKDDFARLAVKYPRSLIYPDREAEYHLIYNYFYETPDKEVLSKRDFTGLFQCVGINDFLPEKKKLYRKINRCYNRCQSSVITASDLFSSTHQHAPVVPFDLAFDFTWDFYSLNAHLGEIKYHALKVFYKISSRLWRHISKAYKCSYRCWCAEAKLELLNHFTNETRKHRRIGKFVAERMGWSNTSLNGHVRYRWPFKFLLNKVLRKDKAYDYLKIFGQNFKSFLLEKNPYE